MKILSKVLTVHNLINFDEEVETGEWVYLTESDDGDGLEVHGLDSNKFDDVISVLKDSIVEYLVEINDTFEEVEKLEIIEKLNSLQKQEMKMKLYHLVNRFLMLSDCGVMTTKSALCEVINYEWGENEYVSSES